MPHVFTNGEYADMVFVYGFCNGNAAAAAREYGSDFPTADYPIQKCSVVFLLDYARLVQYPAVIWHLNVQMNKM